MTIKSRTEYDQHAHEQPTQASEWAASHMGDTARVERSLRGMFGQDTYDSVMGNPGPTEGGGIVPRTPERDAALLAEHPGLMRQWMERGSRSDGQNG